MPPSIPQIMPAPGQGQPLWSLETTDPFLFQSQLWLPAGNGKMCKPTEETCYVPCCRWLSSPLGLQKGGHRRKWQFSMWKRIRGLILETTEMHQAALWLLTRSYKKLACQITKTKFSRHCCRENWGVAAMYAAHVDFAAALPKLLLY